MFESILFRRQSSIPSQPLLDIGSLVEALIFYRSVHIIIDRSTILPLLQGLGSSNLVELVDRGLLRPSYLESWNAVRTHRTLGGKSVLDPILFSSPQHMFPDVLRDTCITLIGSQGKGRRAARRLEDKIEVIRHDPVVMSGIKDTFQNKDALERLVQVALKNLVPGVGTKGVKFELNPVDDRYAVKTNIDWLSLNQHCRRYVAKEHSNLTPAYILSCIFNVEVDLFFASTFSSELCTSPLNSSLISERINYLIYQRSRNREQIDRFQTLTLGEAKSVREAVNNGIISVDDLMPVIRNSHRFKKWVNDRQYNADLVAEYYKEISRESVIDRLPGKFSRWALFTAGGVALDGLIPMGLSTPVGMALGALDALVLDKLIQGWRPNQFVEDELGKVLTDKGD